MYRFAFGAHGNPAWVVAWLLFAAIAGVVLIKQARFSLVTRLAHALSQGRFSIAALIDSFRTVIAGLLLVFPGFISDALAILLLLIPLREPAYASHPDIGRERSRTSEHPPHARESARGHIIDGEFRRE
jgi:UPF0716 protein FxsA